MEKKNKTGDARKIGKFKFSLYFLFLRRVLVELMKRIRAIPADKRVRTCQNGKMLRADRLDFGKGSCSLSIIKLISSP